MAYDTFYSDLSTRGTASEILNLAKSIKEEIVEAGADVIADAALVHEDRVVVEALAIEVDKDAATVDAQAIQVQNNATLITQMVSEVIIEEAPKNGLAYSRQDGAWVTGSTVADFFNVSMYFDTVTYGPGNTLAKIFPRMNLSRPILPSCYVRRDTVSAQNLFLKLRYTDPANPWEATCTIPAGSQEGYFLSGTAAPLDAAFGLEVIADPVPATAPVGLAISLQFEVAPDPSLSTLK